jgi:hypothetical protein
MSIESDLALLKWMVGTNIALNLGIVVLVMRGFGHG